MGNKSEINWQEIRSNYPLLNRYTYLNIASSGAISNMTQQTISSYFEDQLHHAAIHRNEWLAVIQSTRERAALLLGTTSDNIGFVSDVSTGMNQLAERVSLDKKVILVEGDFPSVNLPWVSRGFQIDWVNQEEDRSISISSIKKAIGNGGKILAMSWVQYSSGFTIDLEELSFLCKKSNTLLVIDATQGVGNLPVSLDQLQIDVFMASSFKWQAAGYGICIYYEKPELSEILLGRKTTGWNTLNQFDGALTSDNYQVGAQAVEAGHAKYASLYALNSSLGELEVIGYQNIYERNQQLRSVLSEVLTDIGMEFHSPQGLKNQSPILCVKATHDTFNHLTECKVMVTNRKDYIRTSVHFYNNEEDIFRFRDTMINHLR